jgi:hypothetical protein
MRSASEVLFRAAVIVGTVVAGATVVGWGRGAGDEVIAAEACAAVDTAAITTERDDIALLRARLARAEAVMRYASAYRISIDLSIAIYDIALDAGVDPDLVFRLALEAGPDPGDGQEAALMHGYGVSGARP